MRADVLVLKHERLCLQPCASVLLMLTPERAQAVAQCFGLRRARKSNAALARLPARLVCA